MAVAIEVSGVGTGNSEPILVAVLRQKVIIG